MEEALGSTGSDLDDVQEELVLAKDALAKSEKALAQAQAEASTLRQEMCELKKAQSSELTALRTECSQHKEALEHMKKQKHLAEVALKAAEEKHAHDAASTKDSAELAAQLERVRASELEAKNALDVLKTKTLEDKAEIASQRAELEQLRAEVAQLKAAKEDALPPPPPEEAPAKAEKDPVVDESLLVRVSELESELKRRDSKVRRSSLAWRSLLCGSWP